MVVEIIDGVNMLANCAAKCPFKLLNIVN